VQSPLRPLSGSAQAVLDCPRLRIGARLISYVLFPGCASRGKRFVVRITNTAVPAVQREAGGTPRLRASLIVAA
jgi:hypothetical protein